LQRVRGDWAARVQSAPTGGGGVQTKLTTRLVQDLSIPQRLRVAASLLNDVGFTDDVPTAPYTVGQIESAHAIVENVERQLRNVLAERTTASRRPR
jgi:hypothetical protein